MGALAHLYYIAVLQIDLSEKNVSLCTAHLAPGHLAHNLLILNSEGYIVAFFFFVFFFLIKTSNLFFSVVVAAVL